MKTKMISNETIFTMNWAEHDPRSVKASLNGKGDGRVLWWKINQRIHQLVRPKKTLEEITFSFHSRHHAIALFISDFRLEVNRVTEIIRSEGLAAGIRKAASVTGNHSHR
ncbi:hypothetical protein [Massilia sp. CT11-137]|uniref:hypothetical protein n=1 Tax=Massilia sp. CT11-137 TaxID=3393901 RepID=UPI0039A48C8E